jgi:hypothetical protein
VATASPNWAPPSTTHNAFVVGNDGSVKLVADRIGELYYAREREKEMSTGSVFAAGLPCTKTFEVWHRRLGHINARDMSEAISKGSVLGLEVLKPMNFARDSIECLQGKMVRTPFPKRSDRTSELLELIHSDVCGPMRVESMSKARYFMEAFISEIPARIAPEVDEWYDAMGVEIRSIIKNNTWKLVKRPDDREVIGSRIVLRNKYTANGTLERRRKARLVAQGFSQRPGVHFKETFAPVARLSSIRLLASTAAQYDMNIRQFDVTCANLNGELEEEIFMEPSKYPLQVLEMIQSEEDREVGNKARKMLKQLREGDHVCLLKKSLYGLRQPGRSWYAKLDGILRRFGAVPTKANPCVYQIGTGEESTLIAIYHFVDTPQILKCLFSFSLTPLRINSPKKAFNSSGYKGFHVEVTFFAVNPTLLASIFV